MWSLTVKVILYISRGDETSHKMKKIILFYRYRLIVPHELMAHCTRLVTKLIFRKNVLFIKLQINEYEVWAMHR